MIGRAGPPAPAERRPSIFMSQTTPPLSFTPFLATISTDITPHPSPSVRVGVRGQRLF